MLLVKCVREGDEISLDSWIYNFNIMLSRDLQ